MRPGVLVKELGIMVDTSDDSYMPKTVVVLVGNRESNLTQLKTIAVPRYIGSNVVSGYITACNSGQLQA